MLEKQRKEIDAIDKELVALFEKRMAVALEVATIKKEHQLPVFDAKREQMVFEKVISYLENDTLKPLLKEVYSTLMKVSKDYQNIHLSE
ncbi:chorismate mutase [Carnobacteriaceae bacterium zg-ZUI78]|uniref:chorismate mutase n=1 Tax=Granulicatella sp. zg-84 TaxID=2678503 RepID=UPI0013BF34BD|nr:chorismate mutase [Granulicatella sp. zg-84]MBS4749821.1 chorismate mutase [Carnobacteriaceae bacterium zg-ZUI78]NEW66239.1 chorismate mutase [Granulicatella sp. zg-84]QMI85920.1 chorismate mutase [Carnobacteriaceae bacterium zg-84]